MLALAMAVAGCGLVQRRADDANAPKRTGGTLRFSLGSGPATLDGADIVQQDATVAARPLFSGLTTLDANGNVELDLARSIHTSRDGLTVTIRLRKGLRWSNGTRLTSKDVLRTWRDMYDPEFASPAGVYYFSDLFKGAQQVVQEGASLDTLGITAPDATTVVATLSHPTPYFEQLLTLPGLWPMPPDAHTGGPLWWTRRPLVSSGPFKLVSAAAPPEVKHLEMVRNEHYWDARHVQLDAIDLRVLKDPQAALAQIQAGKLDGASAIPDPATIERLRGTAGFSQEPGAVTVSLVLRPNRALLRNPLVRKGIALAIDRTLLAASDETGAQPTLRMTAPKLDHARQIRNAPGPPDPPKHPDTEAARALFKKAGVKRSDELVILAVYPHRTAGEQAIAEGIERAGLRVRIKLPKSPDNWVEIVSAGTDPGYDAYQLLTASTYPDPNSMLSQWTCRVHYCNPDFDQTLETANSTVNRRDRADLLAKAESILTGPDSGHLVIPLTHPGDFLIYTDRVTGERSRGESYLYLNRLALKRP